jgi:hypothetical protein
VVRIEVEILRPRPHELQLRYEVTGRSEALRIPPAARPERTDGLWRGTCFEAFLRAGEDDGYCEFNLSPSGRWAAYGFGGYREGMTPLELAAPPKITVARTEGGLTLQARLDLAALPGLPPDRPWRLGLAAVIEAADGTIAYWALAPAPGKPDFHHPDGFACEVRAPEDA